MGFGTSPVGGFPVGFSSPTTATAPATPTRYVRAIGVDTKDYAIDATGAFARTSPVRQRVVLALCTMIESSNVQRDWGISRPPKMGRNFEAQVEAAVRKAMWQLVDVEKLVAIESVTVERGSGGRARATMLFRDLTTDQTFVEGVTLG